MGFFSKSFALITNNTVSSAYNKQSKNKPISMKLSCSFTVGAIAGHLKFMDGFRGHLNRARIRQVT